MSDSLRANSLTQEEVTPYALKALESFRDHSLQTGEVFRLADNLAVQNNETRYMSSQLVRLVLIDLARQGVIHRREAAPDDAQAYRSNQVVWLHSASDPVPRWSHIIRAQIEEHTPAPRLNPDHRPTGISAPRPVKITDAPDTSGRAELIVTLVRELAKDADAGVGVQELRAENERLVSANTRLVTERNDAVKKARALEKVYRTMGKLLEEPDTSG